MCKNVVVGTCRWFVLVCFVLVVIPVAPDTLSTLLFFFVLFPFYFSDTGSHVAQADFGLTV